MNGINGATQLFGIIGDPVRHSFSPAMHNAAFKALGLNMAYVPLPACDLAPALDGLKALGFGGVSVTIPHKQAVLPLLDEVEPVARRIGAVNTIRIERALDGSCRLLGKNTDWLGANRALAEVLPLAGSRVLLLGAGGSARAVGFGLREAGAEVLLANRTRSRAEELARELGGTCVAWEDVGEVQAEALVNTTSVGMTPYIEASPVPAEYLGHFAVVMDIVYAPRQTRLLQEAAAAGCTVIDGLQMLLYQGMSQFEWWTGLTAPATEMRRALEWALACGGWSAIQGTYQTRQHMCEMTPVARVDATVRVPGSKSLTQRALIIAALAEGDSFLLGPLASEDTHYTSQALAAMGVTVDTTAPERWQVRGCGGMIQAPAQEMYLGNNGTATRFLTSVAALAKGICRIGGDERMAQRPIEPLLAALRGWGVSVISVAGNGCPPLLLHAGGLAGGPTVLPEGKSSQYLSSLLLVAPYARQEAELAVEGEVLSQPYVMMTLAVMAAFGVRVEAAPGLNRFRIPQGRYRGREYAIEGDASSASYFWAAAAVTGGRVTVANVPVPSLQGDAGLVPLLARMGCQVRQVGQGLEVCGAERLDGISVDMGDMPDVAPTLAVVAAFAEGDTVIENIAHLRIKECDRISAVVTELRRLGAEVTEEPGRMIVHGRGGKGLHGADIATYHDHRLAMSFAVAGLRVPGVRIVDPDCVCKSFPDFWQRFGSLAV